MLRMRFGPSLAALALATLLSAGDASAFCGFYVSESGQKLENEASQVVLMRVGTRTILSMQNAYKGPVESFAMVVPVPVVLQKENVKTLARDLLEKVEQLDAPRLVEYWEQDPCAQGGRGEGIGLGNIGAIGHGAGSGTGFGFGGHVEVHARFSVGEYDVVILGADDSGALEAWLHDHHYAIPAGASAVLRPYVQAASKFFVAKVDPRKVKFEGGRAILSPLRVHYDSETFSLPVRLGLLNSAGMQDLVVHVLAPGTRYEVANYANVTIPTNLDVAESTKGQFAAFYASLFDRITTQNPRAVVTEYAWQSSTCDPCPGPTLDGDDIQTLGGDVAPTGSGALRLSFDSSVSSGPLAPEVVNRISRRYHPRFTACFPADAKETTVTAAWTIDADGSVTGLPTVAGATDEGMRTCIAKALMGISFPKPESPGKTHASTAIHVAHESTLTPTSMVLTRLHMRYSKEMLGDDLVFKVAAPIAGGREFLVGEGDAGTRLEQGSRSATTNNFQARYAIRHPWTGKLECEHPVRGIWGGPTDGTYASPQAATKTAFAPRGSVQLASFLTEQASREIGLASSPAPSSSAAPATSATSAASARSGGCSGCALGDSGEGAPFVGVGALAAALLGRLRRNKKRGVD